MKKTKPKKPATKVLRVTFTVRVPVDVTAKEVRANAHEYVTRRYFTPMWAWNTSTLIGKPRVEDVGAR